MPGPRRTWRRAYGVTLATIRRWREPRDDVGRVTSLDVEADEAGGERRGAGSAQPYATNVSESPACSRETSVRIRASTRAGRSASWNSNASASAHRCSNLWNPPGVSARAAGDAAGCTAREPARRSSRRRRRTGSSGARARARRASRPDEAGATRAEQPLVAAGDEEVAAEIAGRPASTPKPCTPSTHSSARLAAARRRSAAAGSFTPVLECTQVSATTRVRAVTAAAAVARSRPGGLLESS